MGQHKYLYFLFFPNTMNIKIYRGGNEIRALTEVLAQKLKTEKATAINSANLTARLPEGIISEKYKEIRDSHVEDSSKYHISGLLTSDAIYFTIYHPKKESPVVISLEGPEIKSVLREFGLNPKYLR